MKLSRFMFWRRTVQEYLHPDDPLWRRNGYGYYFCVPHPDLVYPTTHSNSLRDRIKNWLRPQKPRMPMDSRYWRSDPPLNDETLDRWLDILCVKSEEELREHLELVRDDIWQVSQELSIGRWWFLDSKMARNPYYPEVLEQAKSGMAVIDLACGLGQELRRIKDDGASGPVYAVDIDKRPWDLGFRLFGEYENQNLSGSFRQLDIIRSDPENRSLVEFGKEAVIYLLNDFLTLLGYGRAGQAIVKIKNASQPGTRVLGWVIGQEGSEDYIHFKVEPPVARGCIHTITSIENLFLQYTRDQEWDFRAESVSMETLGFDEVDCKWFASNYFDSCGVKVDFPCSERKALCFLATRIK